MDPSLETHLTINLDLKETDAIVEMLRAQGDVSEEDASGGFFSERELSEGFKHLKHLVITAATEKADAIFGIMDILNQCKFELSSFVLIHMAFGQEKWDLLFCEKLFLRSNLYKFGEMHCKKT